MCKNTCIDYSCITGYNFKNICLCVYSTDLLLTKGLQFSEPYGVLFAERSMCLNLNSISVSTLPISQAFYIFSM